MARSSSDFLDWFRMYFNNCPSGKKELPLQINRHKWIDREWIEEIEVWTEHCELCGWRSVWSITGEHVIIDRNNRLITRWRDRWMFRDILQLYREYVNEQEMRKWKI